MRVRPLVTTSLESATNPYFEGGNRGGGGGEEGVRDDDWMARRTDVRNFLTQRAFQSFIFLLIQCRDPHTVQWLEVGGRWSAFARKRWLVGMLVAGSIIKNQKIRTFFKFC